MSTSFYIYHHHISPSYCGFLPESLICLPASILGTEQFIFYMSARMIFLKANLTMSLFKCNMFSDFLLLLVQRHLKGAAYLRSQFHSYLVSLYFIALSFPEDGIIFHTSEPMYVLPEAIAQLILTILYLCSPIYDVLIIYYHGTLYFPFIQLVTICSTLY